MPLSCLQTALVHFQLALVRMGSKNSFFRPWLYVFLVQPFHCCVGIAGVGIVGVGKAGASQKCMAKSRNPRNPLPNSQNPPVLAVASILMYEIHRNQVRQNVKSHELYEILCLKVEILTAQHQNPPVTDARYEIHPKQFY